MLTKTIGIRFGALCDPISKQLKKQGFYFSRTKVKTFQKAADSITELCVMGFITERESSKLTGRIYKEIVRHVCERGNLKEA